MPGGMFWRFIRDLFEECVYIDWLGVGGLLEKLHFLQQCYFDLPILLCIWIYLGGYSNY